MKNTKQWKEPQSKLNQSQIDEILYLVDTTNVSRMVQDIYTMGWDHQLIEVDREDDLDHAARRRHVMQHGSE